MAAFLRELQIWISCFSPLHFFAPLPLLLAELLCMLYWALSLLCNTVVWSIQGVFFSGSHSSRHKMINYNLMKNMENSSQIMCPRMEHLLQPWHKTVLFFSPPAPAQKNVDYAWGSLKILWVINRCLFRWNLVLCLEEKKNPIHWNIYWHNNNNNSSCHLLWACCAAVLILDVSPICTQTFSKLAELDFTHEEERKHREVKILTSGHTAIKLKREFQPCSFWFWNMSPSCHITLLLIDL